MWLNLHKLILVAVLALVPCLAWGATQTTKETTGPLLTAAQLLDDIVHASDAAFSKGVPIMCQFDDTSPGTTTENNVRPVRCSTLRELFGIIRDAAGNARGANVNASNELLVNANTEFGAASSTPNSGAYAAPTAPDVWAFLMCKNGSTYDPCLASPNIAHDAAAAAANPLLIGGYASATAPSDVSADTDAVRAWFLRNGAQVTTISQGGLFATVRDTGSSDSLNVSIVDASGNQITSFSGGTQYTHDAALTVGSTVGVPAMGRASAAAPTDVSADNDAVLPWHLRSGAFVTQLSYGGVLASAGAGGTGTGVPRVIEANDSQLSAGVGATGDAAATAGSTGSLTAKARLMTTQLDTMSTSLASILTAVQLIDDDQTGATPCYITSAASTNATNCKASAGRLIAGRFVNTTSTLYYLRLYNLASAPTCSSATGFVESIPIPHGTGVGGGIAFNAAPTGQAFGTGIGFCLTGGGSSTDNTNAATGVYVTLNYK